MVPQKILAGVIGASQLILGVSILFIPDLFFSAFGFSVAAPDQKYLFGQLAARFLAFGVGMVYLIRVLPRHAFWWDMMLLIQAVDLGVGLYYTLGGGVAWSVSGFPMINAAVFTALLALGRPRRAEPCESAPAP